MVEKIFGAILSLLIIFFVVSDAINIISWRLFDWLSNVSVIIAVVGLLSYAFNKNILQTSFWKIFFWVYLVIFSYHLITALFPQIYSQVPLFLTAYNVDIDPNPPNWSLVIISLIFEVPLLYAMWQLTQSKSKK